MPWWKVKPPHLLLAGTNCHRVRKNLTHILDDAAIDAITAEIRLNVAGLFSLGNEHFQFAKGLSKSKWRQRISRYYYGAYNSVRSLRLVSDGSYSTESDDHKKVEDFPDDFPTRNTYTNKLRVLRTDRNTCDYDHTATLQDLLMTPDEAELLVSQLITDAESYLISKGVIL